MFDTGRFEVQRRRTAEGVRYRMEAADGTVLVGTARPDHLHRDVLLESADGDPVLRVTTDVSGVEDDVSAGPLGLAFAVRDARADGSNPREGSGDLLGLVRREMLSLYRRNWSLLDGYGLVTASVVERSRLLAVARQRVTKLVPYRYAVRADGDEIGRLDGRALRGFVLDVDPDAMNPGLALGAAVVVDAVELLR